MLNVLTETIGNREISTILPVYSSAPCSPQWFAVYMRANHEKRVASYLEGRGIPHFLPLYPSVRRWNDRRVLLDLPLFPGYLFVHLALPSRLQVLEAPGVVRLVGFDGQPYPLPERDIESLRAAMRGSLRFAPHPYLTAGSRVRLVRGPLAGMQGLLLRRKNVYRVVLSLDLIARAAAVEVDAADLERIP